MYHFRIRVMLIVIFGALLMIETRLFHLQIIDGRRYGQHAHHVRTSAQTLPTLRGRIISADGVVLAADLPSYDIAVCYRQLDPLVEGSRWRTVMLEQLKKLCVVRRGDERRMRENG